MKLRPLQDRIIVKRVEEETMTAGGIFIPETAKEKPQKGEIVAVGNGKKTEDGKVIPIDVKVGEKVLFGKYAGTEIKIDGEEYPYHEGRRHPRRHGIDGFDKRPSAALRLSSDAQRTFRYASRPSPRVPGIRNILLCRHTAQYTKLYPRRIYQHVS